MNDIEQLLRETLHEMPAASTRVTDPVALIDKRVRRARLMIGSGVAVVAAAVAVAVVVPMQLSGNGTQNIQISHSPTPTPSPSPSIAAGTTIWQSTGSIALTSGDGWLWELCTTTDRKNDEVAKIDPTTHKVAQTWTVLSDAANIAYRNGTVWLWTHQQTSGDTVQVSGLVQAVDTTTSLPVATYQLNDVNDVELLPQTAGSDALALTARGVVQLRDDLNGIHVVAHLELGPSGFNDTIASTGSGAVWVRNGQNLVELDITKTAAGESVMSDKPKDSVQGAGSIYGPAGPDALWTYDGSRLVQLTPSLLHTGNSVAEGDRIGVPGMPNVVAPDGSGGIFVGIIATFTPSGGTTTVQGVYHLSAAALGRGESITGSTPSIPDLIVQQFAPDGQGGVDFTNEDNQAVHWHPAS